ncbi:MAG TPA: FAD-binding protein, partial [Methylotenera sp.]|nr:FAD-binding protein [Methylotenera sp.]
GIPTNLDGQVVLFDEKTGEKTVSGLYAVGECACVSVHGANRLGSNSLLDLVVFGKAAGDKMVQEIAQNKAHKPLPANVADATLARIARLENTQGENAQGENVSEVGAAMRKTMQTHCGVFRFPELLSEGVGAMDAVAKRAQHITIKDKSQVFNTARIEALELDNLIEVAVATMRTAHARQESRGAHAREDFAERDDTHWLKHSLFFKQNNAITYKPVRLTPLTVESFEPKKRVY